MGKLEKNQKIAIIVSLLIVLTLICVYLNLSWVSETKSFTFNEVLSALLGNGSWSSEIIIREINAPRVIIGIFVGAGLAIAGCAMQAVFRNPLASPYILGFN